ncbi:hypothetical protein ABC382_00410 [Lysinibacillus sp. 1P01SD]|uniref:hypothetical protein n=1 Tax=Lysinibacillus sp. 1P01SD TaxID=3132285 RepID=UPI00399F787C
MDDFYSEKQLLDSLNTLEMMKHETMARLIKIRDSYEYAERQEDLGDAETSDFPSAFVKQFILPCSSSIGGTYTVTQFSFWGTLPIYQQSYKQKVFEYYNDALDNAFDFESIRHSYGKSLLIIQHFMKASIIRDLDNLNRKYIIDSIRLTGIIKDDSWLDLSLYEEGKKDRTPHIQVYLVEDKYKYTFLEYLNEHTHELKRIPKLQERKKAKKHFEKEKSTEKIESNNINKDVILPKKIAKTESRF